MAAPDAIALATLPAPWGPLHVAASERGIVAVTMLATREAFLADLGCTWHTAVPAGRTATKHVDRLADAFARYFDGAPTDLDVPLDLRVGSGWDARVLGGVRRIRRGEVAAYGEVARRIGKPGAARAVGGAVGRNPIAILVPCHRVIAAGGRIGGYGGDWYGSREERLAIKRELLAIEGIVLADDPGQTA
jgi:methylated-DNA-[protein]-cysteine S-methyltransferase